MQTAARLPQAPVLLTKRYPVPNMTLRNVMKGNILVIATCLSIATLSFAAHAQATTGNIVGEAKAGDTIHISNPDTGLKREMKISKDGKYQARNLQAGNYQVITVHSDGSIDSPQQLEVRPGASSRAAAQPKPGDARTP